MSPSVGFVFYQFNVPKHLDSASGELFEPASQLSFVTLRVQKNSKDRFPSQAAFKFTWPSLSVPCLFSVPVPDERKLLCTGLHERSFTRADFCTTREPGIEKPPSADLQRR
jgi:hypothetical protein